MKTDRIRPPAVAGMFYPGDAKELRAMVQKLLNQAPPVTAPDPVAMVVPHAGFVYSGLTAACAYKALAPAPKQAPRRVFLLGPSHRVWLDGASVGNYEAFETPLGQIEVDQEVLECLAARPDISRDAVPHRQEHSLETQLPFLQMTLVNFKIIPIVYGEISGGHLADLVSFCWQPGDLIVASTDLSHHHSYDEARRLDGVSNQAVLTRDAKAMDSCEACGSMAVQAVLATARRHNWRPTLMDIRNSGDVTGDRQRVVGYASYLFHPEEEKQADPMVRQPMDSDHSAMWPSLARDQLTRTLNGQSGLAISALKARWPELAQPGACFVTLKDRGGLRGCIGTLEAHRPLGEDLLENTVAAALRDPRFPPLTAAELPDIEIEVSILTPPEPFLHQDGEDLVQRLRPGVHGVILRKHGRRATFLPQVWEQLPDPRDFLEHLCHKAGLDGSCWRQGAEILVYTVKKSLESKKGV
ncbi:MAG: AmmeMemoRadiSam system protein B [Magnetococcus sp. YQC-5]